MSANDVGATQEFVAFFREILKKQELTHTEQVADGYYQFRCANRRFILDFMPVPYTKPDSPGYHFCLDHFLFHKEALESRLLSILGLNATIFARNCKIQRIDKFKAEHFFNINHLAGYRKAKFKYGLYHKDQLMAAITFAQGRTFGKAEAALRSYECVGFCQAKGYTVTGGLSKLIKHFVRETSADHLATYIDLDWSEGDAFRKLGFKPTQKLNPLPFNIDWETGKRSFPARAQRKQELAAEHFVYINSGYLKFEHLYKTKTRH